MTAIGNILLLPRLERLNLILLTGLPLISTHVLQSADNTWTEITGLFAYKLDTTTKCHACGFHTRSVPIGANQEWLKTKRRMRVIMTLTVGRPFCMRTGSLSTRRIPPTSRSDRTAALGQCSADAANPRVLSSSAPAPGPVLRSVNQPRYFFITLSGIFEFFVMFQRSCWGFV